jgi:hypothetical protein
MKIDDEAEIALIFSKQNPDCAWHLHSLLSA